MAVRNTVEQGETGDRMIGWGSVGRDVIAITSVGGRTLEWAKSLPGDPHVPLRTAAMAMAALPKACTPPILHTPYSIL